MNTALLSIRTQMGLCVRTELLTDEDTVYVVYVLNDVTLILGVRHVII